MLFIRGHFTTSCGFLDRSCLPVVTQNQKLFTVGKRIDFYAHSENSIDASRFSPSVSLVPTSKADLEGGDLCAVNHVTTHITFKEKGASSRYVGSIKKLSVGGVKNCLPGNPTALNASTEIMLRKCGAKLLDCISTTTTNSSKSNCVKKNCGNPSVTLTARSKSCFALSPSRLRQFGAVLNSPKHKSKRKLSNRNSEKQLKPSSSRPVFTAHPLAGMRCFFLPTLTRENTIIRNDQ